METLNRNTAPIRMRNYGRIIQDMIAYTCSLPEGDKRRALTVYIGQCMRQKNIAWNKDSETIGSARIKDDIRILSHGQLDCDFEEFEQTLMKRTANIPKPSNKSKKH